jgi:hypothetical protein
VRRAETYWRCRIASRTCGDEAHQEPAVVELSNVLLHLAGEEGWLVCKKGLSVVLLRLRTEAVEVGWRRKEAEGGWGSIYRAVAKFGTVVVRLGAAAGLTVVRGRCERGTPEGTPGGSPAGLRGRGERLGISRRCPMAAASNCSTEGGNRGLRRRYWWYTAERLARWSQREGAVDRRTGTGQRPRHTKDDHAIPRGTTPYVH